MLRSWRVNTLTGAAQPVFGDVTTAAISAVVPRNGIIPVHVADTTKYQQGDRIVVEPDTVRADTLLVDSIPSALILNCKSEGGRATHAHATAVILQLSIACIANIMQTLITNGAFVWLGTDATVTNAGGGSAFGYLTPAGVWPGAGIPSHNVSRTSDLWMAGGANDKIGVCAQIL